MTYQHVKPRTYKGSLTDTDRWQHYRRRAGDVFVCTPPKCGTTWTTTIVRMLLKGSTEVSAQDQVQWLDAHIIDLDEVLGAMQAVGGPRCIKTHTPFDGIPWFDDVHYIAVYRHPLDVLFSLRKHLLNAYDTPPDHPFLADAEQALNSFVTHGIDPADFDFDCLATLVLHYQTFIAQPQPENLLLLHYTDMLADPHNTVETIARHIGVDAAPDAIDAVVQAASFGAMKSKADQFAPFAEHGYWRDPAAFFDSGGTGKWAGKLPKDALRLYRDQLNKSLTKAQQNWLENGDSAPNVV